MRVASFVWAFKNAHKAPNVELSLKRLVLCLLEILWHCVFDEDSRIVDLESIITRKPRDDGGEALFFSCVEHFVNFPREWSAIMHACRRRTFCILLVFECAAERKIFEVLHLGLPVHRHVCFGLSFVDFVIEALGLLLLSS